MATPATATIRAAAPDASTGSLARLVAQAVAGYLFTPAEVQQLGAHLTTARLAVYEAVYRQAARHVGATLLDDWQVPADARDAQQHEAEASAATIAATHQADITRAATTYASDWQDERDDDAGDDGDDEGDDRQDLAAALVLFLGGWCTNRATWKPNQIARYETNVAAAAGVGLFMADLGDGDLGDAGGEALDTDQMGVIVLPETAKEPFCQDYAGLIFPLEAYDEIDVFPAHLNCDHFVSPIMVSGGDMETEW